MGKRYYWLKLKSDFFSSKRIKKLRNMAGGDTYTIIYLKMQLLAIKSDGILSWTGLEDNFAEELALDIDERPDDVEVTLMYLLKTGLAETQDNKTFFFPYAIENTGSETADTQRWREWKSRQALESNANLLESNKTPTLPQQNANVEIEKEIEIEKDTEIERENAAKPPRPRFTPPTLEEVTAYCKERGNGVDAQHFLDHYSANGWKVGKNPMKDWKAAVRTWERNGVNSSDGQTRKRSPAYMSSGKQTALSAEDWDKLMNSI